MTKKVAAEDFGQNWATLLEEVEKNNDEVLVEKDGRIVARLVSTRDMGPMYGTVLFEGDIVSPVTDPDDWYAMK